MKFLRTQPTHFYTMEICQSSYDYDDEFDQEEGEEIGWDEWLARGKVIKEWDTLVQAKSTPFCIKLFLVTEEGDAECVDEYYGDKGWAGGKNPTPVSTDVEIPDWDATLKAKDKRSRLVRKRKMR